MNNTDNFSTQSNNNVQPLLERVFMFLEDGDFEKADEYCERILDIEPKNAQAYLGKLMARFKARKKEDLANPAFKFETDPNYQKFLRFADDSIKNELEIYKTVRDEKLNEVIYNNALASLNNAKSSSDCSEALRLFEKISARKDVDEKISECKIKLEAFLDEEEKAKKETQQKKAEKKAIHKKKFKRILKSFISIAAALISLILFIAIAFNVIIPLIRYEQAKKHLEAGNIEKAYRIFSEVKDYKDSFKYLENFNISYESTVINYYEPGGSVRQEVFGPNDTLLKSVIISPDGSETIIKENSYNANGILIKKLEPAFSGDGTIITEYDENGKKQKATEIGSDGKEYVSTYTYDSNGNLIKAVENAPDLENWVYDYTYDSKGNLIKEVLTIIISDTNYKSTTDYTYDSNGRLLKVEETDLFGTKYTTKEYAYDSYGNKIKEIITDKNHNQTINEFAFDSNGNMTKKSETDKNGRNTTINYFYNKNSQISKEVTSYDTGNTSTTEYFYDPRGNKTKTVTTNADGYESITEYTYYQDSDQLKTVSFNNGIMSYTKYGQLAKHVVRDNVLEYTYGFLTGRLYRLYSSSGIDNYTYYYGFFGNKYKTVCDNMGEKRVTKHTYDINGILTEETSYDEDGNILIKTLYEYDENGVVLKRTDMRADDEITYEVIYKNPTITYSDKDIIS